MARLFCPTANHSTTYSLSIQYPPFLISDPASIYTYLHGSIPTNISPVTIPPLRWYQCPLSHANSASIRLCPRCPRGNEPKRLAVTLSIVRNFWPRRWSASCTLALTSKPSLDRGDHTIFSLPLTESTPTVTSATFVPWGSKLNISLISILAPQYINLCEFF
ncbi:hypothetical protein BJV74DRAFT_867431 [Russula compacta]|nr:hypothetical protein BJV74DRAFT_867431 [Russula compacta]